MKKTLLDYFSKKRKEPCNENESDSQGNSHSSVESQESISRMSMSISDDIETLTCDIHEERSHISPSTDVQGERRSEACLFGPPSNPSTERTSVSGAAITTAEDESRPLLADLDSQVEQRARQDEPFENDPSKPPFFENKEAPCQPNLEVYPGTRFGPKERRFKSSWYSEYKWLEYNEEMDACFCFTCRLCLPNPTETAFTKTGFRDWKHAKEKGKGFHQHQFSFDHLKAMEIYEERNMRNLRKFAAQL